jgi:N-(2-amino-2-carboxyethyl)-L-glutamate synthase
VPDVIASPLQFNVPDLYVDLSGSIGHQVYLKCEGFNFAGSVKLKAAMQMVEAGEQDGLLRPGDTIVESSSGNMGVALSIVAACRGYRFVCVTDERCTVTARRQMAALGTTVHVVTDLDEQNGYLGTRLAHVRRLCRENHGYVWLNQYSNDGNWLAHYRVTGPEIIKAFPQLSVLFIGAGTTGTLMGCARYLREHHPDVRVVAVDVEGSVTFGTPAGRRLIPGLGTSVRPAIFDRSYVDDVVHVGEPATIAMCERLARNGFLFGGSTGSVVAGAARWLADTGTVPATAVAIAPDLGTQYLDTIYSQAWQHDNFGSATH